MAAGEVGHAQPMVAAYDEALAAGRGPIEFEGKMIDIPVVEPAEQVLDRSRAIRARRLDQSSLRTTR